MTKILNSSVKSKVSIIIGLLTLSLLVSAGAFIYSRQIMADVIRKNSIPTSQSTQENTPCPTGSPNPIITLLLSRARAQTNQNDPCQPTYPMPVILGPCADEWNAYNNYEGNDPKQEQKLLDALAKCMDENGYNINPLNHACIPEQQAVEKAEQALEAAEAQKPQNPKKIAQAMKNLTQALARLEACMNPTSKT